MKDPVKLFHAAVKGLEDERWRDVAELCDPVSLRAFNDAVHRDDRVDIAMLSVGDGLTLARKR